MIELLSDRQIFLGGTWKRHHKHFINAMHILEDIRISSLKKKARRLLRHASTGMRH